jgi:hypothetical protein
MSGSTAKVNRDTQHRVQRRRDRGSFRVIRRQDKTGEELYAVVGPSGVALYTFSDLHEANAEAAELNAPARGR